MDKHIEDILRDLYSIDPSFKAHEKELISVISELRMAKPDTKFDEQFASRLRSELLETKIRPIPTPYSSFITSRAFFGIVGSALTILIVVPLTYVATQKATSPEKPVVLNPFSAQPEVKDIVSGLSPKQQISNKGMNAFGTIALIPTMTPDVGTASGSTTASKMMSAPLSSGINPAAKNTLAGHGIVTFVYKGDPVTLKDTQGTIFKRTRGIDSGKQLTNIIQNSNFGLAKLSSLNDLHLSTIELSENKKDGYAIGINFDEGSISIHSQAESTSTTSPATLTDSDRTSIADVFVQTHGIDMTVYGKPLVDSGTVIYPLIIDGKSVLEETGKPFGMSITIDPTTKQVSSVNNLTSQTYDSSQYPLETDFNTILHTATSSLALHTLVSTDQGTSTKNIITLGTPQHVLMHYWFFDPVTQVNNELYIPALSFDISYESKNTAGLPTSIVVPLVKDFLPKASSSASKAQ